MGKKNKDIRALAIPIMLADSKKGPVGEVPDTSDIQILKCGEFTHPWYGTFKFTPEIFQSFIANFKSNTLGCDIMIDYDHDQREAAGWVKSLFMSDDLQELWASVQWNPPGKQCLDDKVYRYVSIDFSFQYQDNEKQVEYGPVMFGAALTNRPFVKGMSAAVGLNDLHGGQKMDPKEAKELSDKNIQLSDRVKALEAEKASEAKRLSDLAEENKTLKTEQEKMKKESEFAVLLNEGKAVPAQKDAFMKGDMTEFAKLGGKLNLSESGSGKGNETEIDPKDEKSKEAKVIKLTEEKVAAEKISYADALKAVFKAHPELR